MTSRCALNLRDKLYKQVIVKKTRNKSRARKTTGTVETLSACQSVMLHVHTEIAWNFTMVWRLGYGQWLTFVFSPQGCSRLKLMLVSRLPYRYGPACSIVIYTCTCIYDLTLFLCGIEHFKYGLQWLWIWWDSLASKSDWSWVGLFKITLGQNLMAQLDSPYDLHVLLMF